MKPTELRLSLKQKWFDMTKTIKGEDYRKITPYWCNRLLLFKGLSKGLDFWENEFFKISAATPESLLLKYIERGIVTFKNFDINTLTLGYPSNEDKDRIHKREHKGIEIRTGNPEWGAEPGKIYFVIMHGDEINDYSKNYCHICGWHTGKHTPDCTSFIFGISN